ncbi:MAG: hypothetical protein AAB334_02115 [Patescibacteria group bacterium]
MKDFLKKRVCSVCGNNVKTEENDLSFLHSRTNGETLSYHDDITCSGSGKETHLRFGKWVFVATSIIGSALIVGVKYNHDKAKVLSS